MTQDEQIAALNDEVANLKLNLLAEQEMSADLKAEIEKQKAVIKEQDDEIKELNDTIENLAAADAAPAKEANAIPSLEFKHEDVLYVLNEHPDRVLIIPAIGPIKASEAIESNEAVAYLVEREIATKL